MHEAHHAIPAVVPAERDESDGQLVSAEDQQRSFHAPGGEDARLTGQCGPSGGPRPEGGGILRRVAGTVHAPHDGRRAS